MYTYLDHGPYRSLTANLSREGLIPSFFKKPNIQKKYLFRCMKLKGVVRPRLSVLFLPPLKSVSF